MIDDIDTDKMREAWADDRVGSHWDGCAYGNRHHEGCAIILLCRAVDDLRARLAKAEARAERMEAALLKLAIEHEHQARAWSASDETDQGSYHEGLARIRARAALAPMDATTKEGTT